MIEIYRAGIGKRQGTQKMSVAADGLAKSDHNKYRLL